MTHAKASARVMTVVVCLAFFVALIPPPKAHAVVLVDDLIFVGWTSGMYASMGMVAPDAKSSDWYGIKDGIDDCFADDPVYQEYMQYAKSQVESTLAENPDAKYVPLKMSREQYSLFTNQLLAYHKANPHPFGKGSGTLSDLGYTVLARYTWNSELEFRSAPSFFIRPGLAGFSDFYLTYTTSGSYDIATLAFTTNIPLDAPSNTVLMYRIKNSATSDFGIWQ